MDSVSQQLMKLYADYRRAPSIEEKTAFLSSQCMQICRSYPLYGARDRDTIVRYLQESAIAQSGIEVIDQAVRSSSEATKGYYTIRPLRADELEFGNDEEAKWAFASANEVYQKAKFEDWVGLRVDLWTETGMDLGTVHDGLMVKVKYWWRKEGEKWLQVMHHIIYLGVRDGTEGSEGEVLE